MACLSVLSATVALRIARDSMGARDFRLIGDEFPDAD
jgi:hypothetical protein